MRVSPYFITSSRSGELTRIFLRFTRAFLCSRWNSRCKSPETSSACGGCSVCGGDSTILQNAPRTFGFIGTLREIVNLNIKKGDP